MPFVRITTTAHLDDVVKQPLLKSVSEAVSRITGKREALIMVLVDDTDDLRAIGGLNDDINETLSSALSDLITEQLGIPPERIFLNFTNVRGYNWGWNGKTFRR